MVYILANENPFYWFLLVVVSGGFSMVNYALYVESQDKDRHKKGRFYRPLNRRSILSSRNTESKDITKKYSNRIGQRQKPHEEMRGSNLQGDITKQYEDSLYQMGQKIRICQNCSVDMMGDDNFCQMCGTRV